MVVGPPDHTVQADIIFVIEGTAINGAYMNDMKSTYVIPTLEYFSQGTIEDYVCESTSTLYGIVTYQAADCLPCPSSDSFGPYTNPQKVIHMFDKIELIGGKGESHANIAEGLATALQCFDDLQQKREPNSMPQKHCILICNSPPYLLPVTESQAFSGHTVDQLAAIISERGIHLSILSPRKIPALFKLYEKAGGDLQASQTKNYAKDPRHLVLLKGYSLKERPISPGPGPQQHPNTLPLPSLSSPLPSTLPGSPAQPPQQTILAPSQPQQPVFRPNQPTAQSIALANQQQTNQQQATPQQTTQPQPVQPQPPQQPPLRAQLSYSQQGPPSYHPTLMGNNRPTNRWAMMPPQQRPPYNNTPQGSALIAQLTQPPSASLGTFGNASVMNQNTNNMTQQQQQPTLTRMIGQQGTGSNLGMVQQQSPGSTGQQIVPQGQPVQSQTGRERQNIWQGVLEWIEKAKVPSDTQKLTRHVPCHVSANSKDGEPDLKADTWPQKLIMQLMPKQLIGNIGGAYLKNSKSVLFHPTPCEALESLTKVMSTGFAGCVHFTSVPSPNACDIKVLILLYTVEKNAYLGFIPNDQAAFVDRLRKVIQHQKSSQALMRQGQVPQGAGQMSALTAGSGPMGSQPGNGGMMGGQMNSQQASQIGGLMNSQLQGNPLGVQQGGPMGGQQNGPQVGNGANNVNQPGGAGTLMQAMANQRQAQNSQATNVATSQANNNQMGIQGGTQSQGMMGQRPPINQHIEAARQENLVKIQQLRQTLEAAQQQELQFKTQLEMINHMKIQQLQQNLEQAQQQESHFQAQMEQEQQLRAQIQQMQLQRQQAPQKPGQQPGNNQQQPVTNPQQQQQQRMMRPGISSNPGLRHLLQQPQYRQQVMGMQQLPRTQQGNPQQSQQFDDNTFDFLN